MSKILNFLKDSRIFSPLITKLIAWVAKELGDSIKSLAVSHGIDSSVASELDSEVTSLVTTLGGLAQLAWEKPAKAAPAASDAARKDAIVTARINQAAADSAVVANKIAAVQTAITQAADSSPKDMTGVLSELSQGRG